MVFGILVIGDVDGNGALEIFAPTASPDFIDASRSGPANDDVVASLGGWNADGRRFVAGFPRKVAALQPWVSPIVADVDGDGRWDVVASDGDARIHAYGRDGQEAAGFPKVTGQSNSLSVAIGDLNGDGLLDVVATTREGWLFAWKSDGFDGGLRTVKLPAIQWASFHHDDQNTGNLGTPLHVYDRLKPADDCAGGCCCQQSSTPVAPGSALGGLVATLALLGIVLASSRRRRHA